MNALDAYGNELELVDEDSLMRARAALERLHLEDLSAIQQGIDDMQAARTASREALSWLNSLLCDERRHRALLFVSSCRCEIQI